MATTPLLERGLGCLRDASWLMMPNMAAPPRCVGYDVNGREALQLHHGPSMQAHERTTEAHARSRRLIDGRGEAGNVDLGPFSWLVASGHIVTAICSGHGSWGSA
jgi:hypothetical protein